MELTNFFEWYASQPDEWRHKPWLVLGKGPSYERLGQFDTARFNTFGLNHVAEKVPVDIAHAIDLDVITGCSAQLLANCGHLLMPWVPHVSGRPGRRTLAQLAQEVPALREAASEGQLLWYNKTGSPAHLDSPLVRVMNFSAEAPYALLGMAGARTIRSLGIDGGNAYAGNFDSRTLLANGRDSFDAQFDEIARSVMQYKLDASPLDIESPVRVYVAATAEQMLSVKVLEYSIRKHASMNVEVMPLFEAGIPIPLPRDPANQPRTPFSFQRFLIPQIAGYQGRAIYLDSDMQVFADIRGLWQQEMGEAALLSVAPEPGSGRIPQYSVMLLDCTRLDWRIDMIVHSLDEKHYSYEDLMQRMVVTRQQSSSIAPQWNSLERHVPGITKLVHYTDMQTQPWVYALHPLGKLWVDDLLEAIDAGFISLGEVVEQARRDWIRPSLVHQVEHRVADARLLPRKILALDEGYRAPYQALPSARAARGIGGMSRALIERGADQTYYALRAMKRKIVSTIGRRWKK